MSRNNLITPDDSPENPGYNTRLFEMIEQCLKGRTRNYGTVTLDANATTTVVLNPLFESHQTITFMPTTANAASAAPTMYVSARAKGTFTLTHGNTADTDKTFGYEFTG